MTVERSHFIQPDYAHVALDLLLKAPFRISADDPSKTIFIYLLVEHQYKPQRFFMLRLAEYLLETYKMQKRAWDAHHDSDAKLCLQAVLPVVLYTGERHWEKIETLIDVVEAGELFKDVIPVFKPYFLNLRDTSFETLVNEGGFFGQVLWLIQQRNSAPAAFRQMLEVVVSNLEKMSAPDQTRWSEFLSYIHALVYHARSEEEQQPLLDVVDRSVQTDPHRREYSKMGRTIAEMYIDKGRTEGELKGKQQGALETGRAFLLRLLRKRFKKVPRKVEVRIAATTNLDDLQTWLDNFVDAKTMADVGIPLH